MHTGNTTVIATSVMKPLWIGQSIVEDGLPCFNPKYIQIAGTRMVSILEEMWPWDEKTHMPLSVSRHAITLTYGDSVFSVSDICYVSISTPFYTSCAIGVVAHPSFLYLQMSLFR